MLKILVAGALNTKSPLLVVPFLEEYKKKSPYPVAYKKKLDELMKSKDFKTEEGEGCYTINNEKNLSGRILFMSVGKKKELNAEKMREFGASVLKFAQNKKHKDFAVYLPADFDEFLEATMQGTALANYTIARYKTGKDKEKTEEKMTNSVTFFTSMDAKKANALSKRVSVVTEGVLLTRNLVNDPANKLTPAELEKQALLVAKTSGAKATVLNRKQLEKMGAGLILAVNQGSPEGDQAARMVVLDYNPSKSKQVEVAIVGKGIIFDTGGINLKPTRHIEDMHQDMAGAATVLGVFKALKQLGVKKRVLGVLPITQNSISGSAYRPSDIVTSLSGKTVEIGNTDAEGRLVLGDALHYTVTTYKPKKMVDLATLTGACVVALGEEYAGLFSNNDKFKDELLESSKNTDELLWQLPLHKAHEESMKSKVADLRNDSSNSYHAGSSTAAAFLKQFVGETAWCHLDIAGTAYVDRPKKYQEARATGFGVRLLVDLVENL